MVKHKDSECESEGLSVADEPRFRISVCMKRFYSDQRRRAFVSVSARRRVRWLQRRLRRLFALPRALCLLSRGHLLPPDEPLTLLDHDDLVEVVPVHPEDDNTAQDAVESAVDDSANAEEPSLVSLERSPSPIYPDNLIQTKRKALLMLEQYCTQPVVESDARPRRRRVRRRRRPRDLSEPEPEAVPAKCLKPDVATAFREPDVAAAFREPDVAAAFREPDVAAAFREPDVAAACRKLDVVADCREPDEAVVCQDPDVAAVLRNEQQPRAPRVVRSLCSQESVILDAQPVELYT